MQDAFGNTVTTSSASALEHYRRAVDTQLHAWPGVLPALRAALAEAPEFCAAHALMALVHGAWGRGAEARASLQAAREHQGNTSAREQAQVALVGAIIEGRSADALALVLAHAKAHPTDLLSASTAVGAYGLIAFSGRVDHDQARFDFLESLAPHLPPELPWLMANRGWARIELGRVEEGLAMARQAISLRPNNAHNAHIVLHGLFESQQHEAALAFLNEWLPSYPDDALMWGHLHWHGALAELALQRHDAAHARLQHAVLGHLARGTPYMGLADIASLLWRMELVSAAPAAQTPPWQTLPWQAAHEHAARHFASGSNVFGELHLVLLAAARGDRDALGASRQRLQAVARRGHAGAPLVQRLALALVATQDGDAPAAHVHLQACVAELPRLGGSHAQRQVVEQLQAALAQPGPLRRVMKA